MPDKLTRVFKKTFKNRFNKLKGLFIGRKINLIFFVCIFILAQSIGFLTIGALSGLTQIFESIRIPDGGVELNIDVYYPEDMKVVIPYYIKNQGMYDLTDLFIEVDISVNYTDLITRENFTVQVFSKIGALPDCKAFSSLIGYFGGTFGDFNVTAVVEFVENVDYLEPIKFFMDIRFQMKYFWTLISFSFFLDDVGLM